MSVPSAKEDIALTMERQAAARRLLAVPLVTPRNHPEDFALILAHADWLTRRFATLLEYPLIVTPEYARLVKTGLLDSVRHPLRRGSGARFSPRDYANLALCLAALTGLPERAGVREIAEAVHAAAREAGLDIDPVDRMAGRRPFVAALAVLRDWGVIAGPAHALTDYARVGAPGPRFRIEHALARRFLARPPQAASDPEEFLAGPRAEEGSADDGVTDPADRAAVTVLRRLAENAVVYRDDLPEPQAAWLRHHQWRAVAELQNLLGCESEVRAEGVALIAADTEAGFPSAGESGRRALLLLRRLAAALRPEQVPATYLPIPGELMERELRALEESTAPDLPAAGSPSDTAAPLHLLTEHGLLVRAEDAQGDPEWRLPAAAARYAAPMEPESIRERP